MLIVNCWFPDRSLMWHRSSAAFDPAAVNESPLEPKRKHMNIPLRPYLFCLPRPSLFSLVACVCLSQQTGSGLHVQLSSLSVSRLLPLPLSQTNHRRGGWTLSHPVQTLSSRGLDYWITHYPSLILKVIFLVVIFPKKTKTTITYFTLNWTRIEHHSVLKRNWNYRLRP